jgi:hypothetical protein
MENLVMTKMTQLMDCMKILNEENKTEISHLNMTTHRLEKHVLSLQSHIIKKTTPMSNTIHQIRHAVTATD